MLLYTREVYTNNRKDGKEFIHETRDRAVMASEQNKEEYEFVGRFSSFDVRRCDKCREEGLINYGIKTAKGDFCKQHTPDN